MIHLLNEAYDGVVEIRTSGDLQEPQPIQAEEDDKYQGMSKEEYYEHRDDVPREVLEEWEGQGRLTQSGLEKLSEIRNRTRLTKIQKFSIASEQSITLSSCD